MNKMKRIILAGAVALLAASAAAAPYVVLPNGQRVQGSAIRALSNGDINLTTASGIRTFPRGQYLEAVADKPAEYDQAVAALSAKKYDDAIRLLEGVVSRYRLLKWDAEALKLLPQALIGKGDSAEAVKAYDQLFQVAPNERKNPDVAWGMRRAMLAAKQYPALVRQLDAVAASGSRADAARAQTMRGDIQMAQNDLNQAVPEIQGEAHFKAAQALEALRDPNAKDMYRRLVNQYPSSPYAAQAKSKL